MKLRKLEDLDELEELALINMSYSRLNTFDMCNSMYFYTYIQKEDRVFGPPAVMGNVMHSVLEDAVGSELVYDNLVDLMYDYREEYDPDKLIDNKLLQAGETMLGEFVDRHKDDVFDIIDKERQFEVIIGSARIIGYIDLLLRDPSGGIRVVDYKAQPLDTPILTPDGWTRMGDIKVDDEVIGGNGNKVNVVGVYPQGTVPAYRVTFTDNTSTICSDSHLWTVTNLIGEQETVTVSELASRPLRSGWNYRYAIPTVEPVEFNKREEPLPIDPYTLGVILGDGGTSSGVIKIHAQDQEILDRVADSLPDGLELKFDEENVYRISSPSRRNGYKQYLESLGMTGKGSKSRFYIPEEYLRASVEDRHALLQGLMDTDGGTSTRTAFVTTTPALKDGIVELLRSLGGLPMWSQHKAGYEDKDGVFIPCKDSYVINTRIKMNPFYLTYKREGFKERKNNDARRIKSIEPVPDQKMQCIRVENEDGLYVSNDYIVTHNSGKNEVAKKNIPTDLQLGIYVLAMAQEYPDVPIYGELYYLRSARRKGHWFQPQDMPEIHDKVLEKINGIIGERNFLPTQNSRICSFCDFAKTGACPTGKARMRNRY